MCVRVRVWFVFLRRSLRNLRWKWTYHWNSFKFASPCEVFPAQARMLWTYLPRIKWRRRLTDQAKELFRHSSPCLFFLSRETPCHAYRVKSHRSYVAFSVWKRALEGQSFDSILTTFISKSRTPSDPDLILSSLKTHTIGASGQATSIYLDFAFFFLSVSIIVLSAFFFYLSASVVTKLPPILSRL